MSNTHVRGGIRNEDITFRNARRQCEILKEVPPEMIVDTEVQVPVSLTPEQVTRYFLECIKNTQEQDKRRIYAQTIKWISELQEVKSELKVLKAKGLIDSATPKSVE